MAESSRKRSLSSVAERFAPWLPLMTIPMFLALLSFVWDVRTDVHALQAEHLPVHADLMLRVTKIESNRFTKADGDKIFKQLHTMAIDLAVLTNRLNALKIPPEEVEQALAAINRRLNIIEQDLRRALLPSEWKPGSLP